MVSYYLRSGQRNTSLILLISFIILFGIGWRKYGRHIPIINPEVTPIKKVNINIFNSKICFSRFLFVVANNKVILHMP